MKINEIVNNLDGHLFSTYYDKQIEVASKLGKSAVPTLIKLLSDKKYNIRCFSADVLGKIKDKATIPYLIKASRDEHMNVRICVGMALTDFIYTGDKELISALKTLLRDKEWEVRAYVIDAIGVEKSKIFTKDLLELLKDKNEWVRWNVIVALERINDLNTVPFISELFNDSWEFVRAKAYHAVAKMNNSIIDKCIKELRSKNKKVRMFAIKKLGWIVNENTTNNLISIIDNADLKEQDLIACALGEIYLNTNNKSIKDKTKNLSDNLDTKIRNVGQKTIKYIEDSAKD